MLKIFMYTENLKNWEVRTFSLKHKFNQNIKKTLKLDVKLTILQNDSFKCK